MDIAEALRRTRYEANVSQENMAFELEITRKTVQNWEKGISQPSLEQILKWFTVTDKNPIPYLLQIVYPDMDRISGKDEDAKIRSVLLQLVEEMPIEAVRQLLFLFYGDHGSSPRAVMQFVTAHLQTPMKDRVTHAGLVVKDYEIAHKKGMITAPDHIQPNMDILKKAVEKGEDAAVRDSKEYMLPDGLL